ncbi:HAD-IA family hydrolase [Nostocoides sp. Soil756]|jgi:HAD superfamily hydrolase (TIGR01509 family)|uniref:HAD-IA family hydrolase n=1 Tax=Nostocoides sp. Soil756 TaxID=1736399 RepID=UPI0006FD0D39|nr:HAD-IA family hydrolase [Tetrasphaera sp. Soil756]KRE60989.1 haloacid dehalogenase [Tetrasphaera sp. Soil756]
MSALIFDCDGVLADTERYGHLPAFNATFEQFGLPARWDEAEYAVRLRIGGGKERMASLFSDPGFVELAGIPEDADERAHLLARWHKTKSAIFKQMVADGVMPPRPGVARVIREATAAGWTVAIASTSALESVRAVLSTVVGEDLARTIPVFAGDVVPAKKPDPAIYLLAVEELGLDPHDTLVVEDSRNGLRAAVGAGLACLVTVNGHTRGEDFSEATLVVSELGDPGREPVEVLSDPAGIGVVDLVDLPLLSRCIAAHSRSRSLEA